MTGSLMTFTLQDPPASDGQVDDGSDPMEGESGDGELLYSISIDIRSRTQIAAFSGKLLSASSIIALNGVLDSMMAAAGREGVAMIDLAGLEEVSAVALNTLLTRLKSFVDQGGTVQLQLGLTPITASILSRVAVPPSARRIGWDWRSERLLLTVYE